MINMLILFLMLITGGIFLTYKNNKSFGVNISIYLCVMILSIYIFGIFKILKFSIYIFYILSFILLIINIINIVKNKDKFVKIIKDPAFIYTVLLFVLSIIIFRNNYLSVWDEFSHWGIYVKNLFIYDELWNDNFTSMQLGYPPIMSLLEYFTIKLTNTYDERIIYMSLFIASMLPFASTLKSKNKFKNILIIFIILMLPWTFFKDFFQSAYMDAVLGLYFGLALYNYVSDDLNLFNIFKNSLLLSILVLIKEFGIILLGIFIAVMFVDILFFRREEYKILYKESKKNKNIIYLILIISLPLIIRFSWSIFTSLFYTKSTHLEWMLSSKGLPDYTFILIKGYLNTILLLFIRTGGSLINKTTFDWFIFFMMISIIAKLMLKNNDQLNKKFNTIYTIIILSFCIYMGALFISYLLIFGEYEAIHFASYERYIISMLLGLTVFLVLYLTKIFTSYKVNKIYKYVFLSLYFLILGYIPYKLIYYYMFTDEIYKSRVVFEKRNSNAVYQINSLIPGNSNIYYISNGDDGFKYCIAKYILTPNHVQIDYWSLGETRHENDRSSENITLNEWHEKLLEMNYLYIDTVDEEFINKYNKIFINNSEIKSKCLYTVDNGYVTSIVKCFEEN